MIPYDRHDARRIRQPYPLKAVMPYMLRGRNESAVYYEREFDLSPALEKVRSYGTGTDGAEDDKKSMFALLLAAMVRTFALRPALNRYIHRRALYERNSIILSFIVKQRLSDDAPEGSAKVRFDREDGLEEVTRKVNRAIQVVRETGGGGAGEKIAAAAHAVPGGKALMFGLYRLLDQFNLAPGSWLEADPLYASAYVANLGSLGLDAPYHHLYEWGDSSIFIVLGKLEQKESGKASGATRRHLMKIRLTVDERIADGLYFARSASLFARFLADPDLLVMPLAEAEAILRR